MKKILRSNIAVLLLLGLLIPVIGCKETVYVTVTPEPTLTVPSTLMPTTTPKPTLTVPPTLMPTTTPSPTLTTTATPITYPQSVSVYQDILFYWDSWKDQYAADTLRAAGYNVHRLDYKTDVNQDLLGQYGILVINTLPSPQQTQQVVGLVTDWIKAGGSVLFLITRDQVAFCNSILLPLYGIQANDDYIRDTTHSSSCGLYTTLITAHPTTANVQKFSTFGISLKVVDPRTKVIVQGEEDAYSQYYTHRPPLVAVAEHKGGRIVAVSCQENSFPFGNERISCSDNQLFFLNIINWLAHKT